MASDLNILITPNRKHYNLLLYKIQRNNVVYQVS